MFMNIIPEKSPKRLTIETPFSNYISIIDAYSKIPKLYDTENITTKELMDKLDMFRSRFGKIYDEFQHMQVHNLPPQSSRANIKPAVFVLCLQPLSIKK